MTVEQLMAIIGDELEPDLTNLQVFVDVDDDYTNSKYIMNFDKDYELYKDYTVVSYRMNVEDPLKITFTMHIRESQHIYLVRSGSIVYYTRRENIARTIDMLYTQYGTDLTIRISKTAKTI